MFVLTDGEVSNTSEVILLVQANAGNSRVFALGLGESASHELVEGIGMRWLQWEMRAIEFEWYMVK